MPIFPSRPGPNKFRLVPVEPVVVPPAETPFTFIIDPTGTGIGVATLNMESTDDIVLTLDGTAKFYSNSLGTLDESDTWTLTAGALRTIYVRCPSGSSNMVVPDVSKLKGIGGSGLYETGWITASNAPRISFAPADLMVENIELSGNAVMTGALPDTLKKIRISNNSVYWNYAGPMPPNIEILGLGGANILWTYAGSLSSSLRVLGLSDTCYWTYTGALPSGLTILQFQCPTNNSVNWTYTGALPVGLTYLMLNSSNVTWNYNGALPTGLTSLYLRQSGAWVYNGALPAALTGLTINCSAADWTGLDIGDTGNLSSLSLSNYRQAKMSSADMVTLLTQLTNRTGTLPSGITINDYADYAAPPAGVITAVNTLKATKSIIIVILGA